MVKTFTVTSVTRYPNRDYPHVHIAVEVTHTISIRNGQTHVYTTPYTIEVYHFRNALFAYIIRNEDFLLYTGSNGGNSKKWQGIAMTFRRAVSKFRSEILN